MKALPKFGSAEKTFSEVRKRAAGFTLLEVLLAVLVLGLSLVAFFGAVGQAMTVVTAAREYEVARSLMNRLALEAPLDLEDLREGELSGTFSGDAAGFRWRRILTIVGEEEDEFFHVETRIEWGDERDPVFERVETFLHAPSARRRGWFREGPM